MRGSILTAATGEDLASDANAGRSDSVTISPDRLETLMDEDFSPQDVTPLPPGDGAKAGIARWVGIVSRSRAEGNRGAEREACWWLATRLAEADQDIGSALSYGRRALELGGEDAWRVQVSAWLERVGRHKQAAAVLVPSVNQAATAREAARLLARMARLQIRANEHQLALQNLLEAATVWPAYADALDLAGELAATHSMPDASTMLLEAADRHEQNSNRARSFDARRRAFEVAPDSPQACDALATALEKTDREEAADGVRRVHALALTDEAMARAVHVGRLSRAIEGDVPARAIAAIIDGHLEASTTESFAPDVDEALSRAGLHDVVAARWEWIASQKVGAERARQFIDLAGLYLGRLASPDRAVDAWIEALTADPSCGEARAALRTHARSMHDQTALAEALIRIVRAHPDSSGAIDSLKEVAALAEERLSEPSLAAWAYGKLVDLGGENEELIKARNRLTPRVRLQDGALASARLAVEQGDTEERIEGWRRIAAILRGRPDDGEEYLDVLAKLVRTGQGEHRWWVDFERAAVRLSRFDLLEELARERLFQGVPRADVLHLRMTLIVHAWRRGDAASVLRDAIELAGELPGTRAAHANAWVAAAVLRDDEQRAAALEFVSDNLSSSVRATLLALAGEQRSLLRQDDDADRLAAEARKTDGACPRVLRFLADRGVRTPAPDFARTLEKLAAVYLPMGKDHANLVLAFQNTGDHDLAHAWVRRWIDLRPWDLEVLSLLLRTAVPSSAVDTHVAAIMRATVSPLSFEVIEPLLCGALDELGRRDSARTFQVASDLCDLYGIRRGEFRDLILRIAASSQDLRFEARMLERWIAVDADNEDPTVLLRLASLYERLEEYESGARALVRATRTREAAVDVLAHTQVYSRATTGDANLLLLEAKARAFDLLGEREEAVEVWLELGSARWKRAEDPHGAIEAWLVALGDDAVAFLRLSASISLFSTTEDAFLSMRDFGLASDDPIRRASALVVASARAIALARFPEAIDLAMKALREDPRRTDALVLIERASGQSSAPEVIDEAHALAAAGAKGRFGRRAAHLRAARTLEERHPDLAIVHAMAAFEADPIDGSALVLMLRLATRVEPTEIVETLCRVAEGASRGEVRAHWWIQAARVAAAHQAFQRKALDLTFRAFVIASSMESIELMHEIVDRLVRVDPDEIPIVEVRLHRASKALASKLEGPIGARIALSASRLAGESLENPTLAMVWASLALSYSGDIDEYERILPLANALVADREACGAFIDEVLRRSTGLGGTTGPALFGFAGALAKAMGDEERVRALGEARERKAEVDVSEVDPFAGLADELSAESEPPLREEADSQKNLREESSAESSERPLKSSKETLRPGYWTVERPEGAGSSEKGGPTTERGLGARPASVDSDSLRTAEQLENRGEIAAAIEVLEQMEPSEELRPRVDEMLRRLYHAAGRNSKLPLVLERIVERQEDPVAKVGLLTEIAKLREERGDAAGARATWQIVADIDPSHRDAWLYLERDATDRGEFVMLVQILKQRAAVSESVAEIRELRLRRAVLMDRELGLAEEARAELDSLIVAHGGNVAVFSCRAELAERVAGPLAAAPFWVRAAAVVAGRADAVVLLCKAARAYLDANQLEEAMDALALAGDVRTPEVLTLLVEAERRSGSVPARLGDYLDELASVTQGKDETRALWLFEAAEHARVVGDMSGAIDRLRRAALLVPEDGTSQLRAVYLMYRLEGLANREHVVEMLDKLEAIAAGLEPKQLDLHAFLTAECLEALESPEHAVEYLHERKRVAGVGPLIALALADRLAVMGDPQASLPFFDIALRAEEPLGVRTKAQVAFAAARAAIRAGGSRLAAPYMAVVEQEPGAELMLDRLRVEIAEILPPTDEVRRQLDRLARTSRGTERAKVLLQLARLSAARETRASNAEAEGYYEEAIAAASADAQLRADIETERAGFRERLTPSKMPPTVAASPISTVPPPPRFPSFSPHDSSVPAPPPLPLSPFPSSPPPKTSGGPPPRPDAREPSLTSTISSQPPPPDPLPSPEPVPKGIAPDSALEKNLFEALARGDVEAGDQLASTLSGDPNRTQDVLAIRRRQVVIEPYSIRHLELLRDAARADRDPTHAAAVHHVVCVLTGQTSPPPPALTSQPVDADRVLAMIGRGVYGPASEVLGEVWTHAAHLFAREPAAFGLTGVERVSLGAPSPVGRTYALAAPVLGLGKTPVFLKRTRGPMNLAIAALNPMSVVVSGDVQDGPELEYRMGAMLLATMAPNAMLFGLPAQALRQLMKALLAAFGPPAMARNSMSESAVLAAELWRALPGSVQRRFGQLYRESEPFTYEDAWARALQATRRAGLFVAGDLSVALRDVLQDPGNRDGIDVGARDAYRCLCRVSVSAADLVRLASSSEYAEARWHEVRRSSSGTHGSVSG